MEGTGPAETPAGRRRLLGAVWTTGRRWVPGLPIALALFHALVLVVVANFYFMFPRAALMNKYDEGYALAFARRMLEGRNLPYIDAVSHRGPVFYWITAVGVKLLGYGTWMPARVLTLVCMVLTILLGFAAACVARRPLAGAVMGLVTFAAVAVALIPYDGLAFGSEHVVDVFSIGALLLMTWAFRDPARSPSYLALFTSGACVMLSALSKQVGAVAIPAFGLWVLAVAVSRKDLRRRSRFLLVAMFAAGVIVPFVSVVGLYAFERKLLTFFYYFITYNVEVYGRLPEGEARALQLRQAVLGHYEVLLAAVPLVGWAVARVVATTRGPRDLARGYALHGFEITVVLNAALALAMSDATLRHFPHYVVQAVPWLGLSAGIVLSNAAARSAPESGRHPVRAFLVRVALLAPLALLTQIGWMCRSRWLADDAGTKDAFATYDWQFCRMLHERTTPSESIFIWGFDPAPYTACNRRPASRFVYTTFPSGFVPWYEGTEEEEEARVTPRSRVILIKELEHEMPAVILDSGSMMHSLTSPQWRDRTIDAYPFLKMFVTTYYCRDPEHANLWFRRKGPQC